MRIAIGNDHRGFRVKERIASFLRARGHEVVDHGAHGEDSVHYPDYAARVARDVARGRAERGILICGTGLGMAMAANKVPGVRATPAHDDVTAELSRSHNDSNVLCLSADLLGERLIEHVVGIWLDTPFQGGRHGARLEMIRALEAEPLPAEPGPDAPAEPAPHA
jgi:ribose 5-phosphate isomerase B